MSPWTADDPPEVAQNWTLEEREKCVAAANAVLADGGTDQDAIFACIHAAGKSDRGDEDLPKTKLTDRTPVWKASKPIIIKVDAAQGIVTAVVNLYGIIDQGDDIVHLGCFSKSIDERQGKIRVLDNHNNDSITNIVGRPLSIREIGRGELPVPIQTQFPMATGGLLTETQFYMDTEEDRRIFSRVASGDTEWSIGFIPVRIDYSKVTTPDGGTVNVRNIREGAILEYSPVLWGMNQGTATLTAKNIEPPPPAQDAEDSADEPTRKEYTPDGAMPRVGDYLTACMAGNLYSEMNGMLQDGTLDFTEYSQLMVLGSRCIGDFRKLMDENVALRPHEGMMGFDLFYGQNPRLARKSGRVLSARNAEKIRAALDGLMSVLQDAGVYEDASEDTTGSEDTAEPPPEEGTLTVDRLKVELELLEHDLREGV